MSTATAPTGFKAMEQWNKSWKHGHYPMWLKKACTAYMKKKGRSMRSSGTPFSPEAAAQIVASEGSGRAILDHQGSFIPMGFDTKDRWFSTQPYAADEDLIRKFADEVGIKVIEVIRPGPWEPRTTMFVFGPK